MKYVIFLFEFYKELCDRICSDIVGRTKKSNVDSGKRMGSLGARASTVRFLATETIAGENACYRSMFISFGEMNCIGSETLPGKYITVLFLEKKCHE
jgi:hypothetical protein